MSSNEVETVQQDRHVEVMMKLTKLTAQGGFINGLTDKVNAFELNNYIDVQIDQAITSTKQEMVEDLNIWFVDVTEEGDRWMDGKKLTDRENELRNKHNEEVHRLIAKYSPLKDLQDRKVEE